MTAGPPAVMMSPMLAFALALAAAPADAAELEANAAALVAAEEPGYRLRSLVRTGDRIDIGLELPAGVPTHPVPDAAENLFESLVGLIGAASPEIVAFDLLVARPGGPLEVPGRAVPIIEEERVPPPGQDPLPFPALPFASPPASRFPYGQALAGRTVAISPGHGYIYFDSLGRYSTQRANLRFDGCGDCRGIVEDFGTHQLAVRYLIPLLEGAGARVILLRERSEDPGLDLVDDGAHRFSTEGRWQAGANEGGHSAGYLASFDPGATATYRLFAPSDGPTLASLWFLHGANRIGAAWLGLGRPGRAEIRLELDQTTHGRRWVPLSALDLTRGDEVELRLGFPPGAGLDRALIADAVRLGAGRHESGHPWWQMGAAPFAAHQSAPPIVLGRGDVTVRPAYAEWFGADIYVSLHSNASGQANSTASGSVTYRHSCRAVADHASAPSPSVCDHPPGSDRLQRELQAGLVRRIRADWDPAWRDRGNRVANFGEVRELSRIPGVLVETAFHDHLRRGDTDLRTSDNQALHDPRWRRAAAWGLYEGITRFLAGPSAPLVPPAPRLASVERIAEGQVRLHFESSAPSHRVEIAVDGYTFVPGALIGASPAAIDGLPAGQVVAVRVRGLNAGGEGPPSRALAARAGPSASSVLVVDAFERQDAWVQLEDNRGDTAVTHALALASARFGIDGASEAGLGRLELENYRAVVVALGRESTEHGVLTPATRARLAAFVQEGGHLYIGGTELGFALDSRGDDESRAFLRSVLGARYWADDGGERRVRAVGSLAELIGGGDRALAGPGEGRAEARSPDVFSVEPGFEPALAYGDGTAVAAVLGPRTLAAGFSLEHLRDARDREALLGGWLFSALGEDPPPPPPDAGIPPDAGGTDPMDDAGRPPVDAGAPSYGQDGGGQGGDGQDGQDGLRRPPVVRATEAPPIAGGCKNTQGVSGFWGLFVLAWWRTQLRFNRRTRPS